MTKARTALLLLALSLAEAAPLNAQIGPFIDWINKMSGPRFQTVGLTYRFGYNPGQSLSAAEYMLLQRQCGSQSWIQSAPSTAYDEATVDLKRHRVHKLELAVALQAQSQNPDQLQSQQLAQTIPTLCAALTQQSPTIADRSGWRGRFGFFYGYDRDNVLREINIRTYSPQLTLEWVFSAPTPEEGRPVYFGLEGGVRIWPIQIDPTEDEDTWTTAWSIPLQANYYPFAECPSWLLRNLRVGAGVNVMLFGDSTSFAPSSYATQKGIEVVPTAFIALDVSKSSLSSPKLGCDP